MNKKKLLLTGLLIGMSQAYGMQVGGENSYLEKIALEERKSQIKKTYKSELGNQFDGEDVFKPDQRKEGHVEIEKQREKLEQEFFKLGKDVDILRLNERRVRESIFNLEQFKRFLENAKSQEEDLVNKEDLIMREALLEYAFKSSRFNSIQEELLLKGEENKEFEKALIQEKDQRKKLEEKIKGLSGLQTPLDEAENHYKSVLTSLKLLHEEDPRFDENREALKRYLCDKLEYDENDDNVKKVLQKNLDVYIENKITIEERIELFNALDHEAAQIRTNLVFTDFARRLTTLLVSKQFAPVAVPSFHEISSDPNATLKWQENTKKLIDFIIADWQSIKNKEINFKNSDNLHLLLGMGNEQFGEIETLIYPLKNMALAEFSARIDSPEKRAELLTLLEEVAGYLDWLKTEFQRREKAINNQLYSKNENSKFTKDYNKKASIKAMHDYLDRVVVASRRYTKAIDFIFQKIGRLTPEECINGGNFYIEAVRPVREIGGLLSVIGLLNMGLSLRGHTLNGMKQSVLELKTYFKNKQLKSAAKYVGASLNKKHLLGLILPVGIGVAFYGHSKTDTLREKRNRFKNVIIELERPYQKAP